MSISGLKGYFEEHDGESDIVLGPKKTKYLTIIFTNEYQKFIYKEVLIEIMLRLSLNQMTMYL